MVYDYLIVGTGLFGAVFARKALEADKTVLMIDKRSHFGGNCYDDRVQGINVHRYGPHQFHTRNKKVWHFVNQFADFNHYRAHIKANYQDKIYSMPPNMMLYHQLWGVITPAEAKCKIEESRIPCEKPKNLKEMVQDAVGSEIYEKFYYGYSLKQWGVDPESIPVSVGKRLPIRWTWTDRWFEDEYEGIPKDGYSNMIANMIDGAKIILDVDYLLDRDVWDRSAKKVLYTGEIDRYFNYCYGPLEYRSLTFQHEILKGDFQGNSIINYTSADVPWTRITEHKHFEFLKSDYTVITKEFSKKYEPNTEDIPYYPVDNARNREIYQRYFEDWKPFGKLGGGRLFNYKYYDMDQVIASAISLSSEEFG